MKLRFVFLFIVFGFCCSVQNILGQTSGWQWAKSAVINSNTFSEGYSVSADLNGNSFITGMYKGPSITFENTTLFNADISGNTHDLFIAKYNTNGNLLWAKGLGGAGEDVGYSVCADNIGSVYLTGYFQSSTITFGSTTLTNLGGSSIFVSKYDANGNEIWAKMAGGTGPTDDDRGFSITANAIGNIYLTGYYSGTTINFGATSLNHANGWDVFVAKYDTSGNVLWARSSQCGIAEGFSTCADPLGNVFVTGYFNNPTITFGSITLNNFGTQDEFIVKYDSIGNVLWAKSVGGANFDNGNSVCSDKNGNAFLTGMFFSPIITFDTFTLYNADATGNSSDAFITKYDPNGNVLWAKRSGGINFDKGYSVCADTSGNVFYTGGFIGGNITFGSTTLTPPLGSTDPMFIVKYDPIGNVLCAAGIGSGGDDQNCVSVDPFGNAYVSGDFVGPQFIVGLDSLTTIGNGEDIFIAKYNCNLDASVNNITNEHSISIFPNPSNGNFTIENNFSGNYEIEIFNSLGQEIFRRENLNEYSFEVDLSGEANGIYFVRIVSDGKIYSQKIVKGTNY